MDEIRRRRWPSLRGTSDDFLVRIAGDEPPGPNEPAELVSRGVWSVRQPGAERIDQLRSLPPAIERAGFAFGRLVLVHATPWSNEEVVLPDAEEAVPAAWSRRPEPACSPTATSTRPTRDAPATRCC